MPPFGTKKGSDSSCFYSFRGPCKKGRCYNYFCQFYISWNTWDKQQQEEWEALMENERPEGWERLFNLTPVYIL